MQPKLRTTILCMCAALLVVSAMPQLAEAQGGYNVRRATDVMKVAQYANNALVNDLTFDYDDMRAEPNITHPAGEKLTIKIGYGLIITNEDSARGDTTASLTLWCQDNNDTYTEACQDDKGQHPLATISNKDGTGVITITVGTVLQSFKVAGVRVDASALAVDDEIMAGVTSTTDATTVGLGGASDEGGVSGVVGKVAAGLKVTAAKDSELACSSGALDPSITVAEGFAMAWGPTNLEMDSGGMDDEHASVKIVLDNLPDDAKVVWPDSVKSEVEVEISGEKSNQQNGTLTLNAAESSSNGKIVVYTYMRIGTHDHDNDTDTPAEALHADALNANRSFTITPTGDTKFMGDASVDISAMLHPMARRGTDGEKLDLDSMLSFEAEMQAPEEGNGEDWLVISECVTYLLYPFITCGATPGWNTGISVSNTTADGNIFGAFDETAEQAGSVVMYGFPSGQAAPAEGGMVEPVVHTVSSSLMAGDTVTFDCSNTTMAGMEGYAIIRAGFQHARGMGFVMGLFEGGSSIDVTHGYMAEVIDNPAERSDAIE